MKKFLKSSLLLLSSVALLSCTAEAPVRTAQYAVQGIYAAGLSDDGAFSLIGSIQHGGSYWNNSKNERVFNWNHAQGDSTAFSSVDIDPTGEFAATASGQDLVLWNAVTGALDGFWTTPANIQSVKLTQNGDFALVGLNDRTARFFDVKNGGIRQTFQANEIVRTVDITPDGSLGITGDDSSTVILWDIQTGEKKYEWMLNNNVSTVVLSADGKYAFAAAHFGHAKVWSTRSGKELSTIDTGSLPFRNATISQAVFSDNNKTILTGEVNGLVSLVQVSTGVVYKEWELYTKQGGPTGARVLALAYGRDSRYHAIGSNGYLNILQ
ncbi:hypothetical protein OFY17_02100 [Marinomonas sp. C2222]|uniref:WD40 repeat domain-containing protein n=1 Tax=Marinomonas sargassi TaxID=2984494 RepID=A0ABT2YP50_9GAMM|nr:hypothetical protein [Marinomonas sargassi]MCV2401666.1 hypothetical protein [Marinomonas sargassi]